jgi:hypothetical protein
VGYETGLLVPGVVDVVDPLTVELKQIERVKRALHGHVSITGVAQPFPVGTVAADAAVKVRPLRFDERLMDSIEQGI